MSAPSRSPATAASSASPVMGTLCSSNCEAKSSIASARVAAVTPSTVKDSLGHMQCLPRRVQGGAEKNEVLHQEPEGRAHGSSTPGVLKRKLKVAKSMPLAPRLARL